MRRIKRNVARLQNTSRYRYLGGIAKNLSSIERYQ